MSQPWTKETLLAEIAARRAELDALLAGLSDEQMARPDVMDGWSIKDILAHMTWWHQRMCTLWRHEAESLFQPGDSDEQQRERIDRLNAQVYAENKDRALLDVIGAFERSYLDALGVAQSVTEADLSDDNRLGLIGGNMNGHYEEHIPAIRAWREAGG